MNRRKSFAPVVLVGLIAAALAAVASSKSWALLDTNTGQAWMKSSGELPLASALSIAALASWGAILVARGAWRRWIALVGLVLALGSFVTAIVGYSKAPDNVRDAAINWLGAVAHGSPHLTGWYWAALIADLFVVVALIVAVRDAPQWPAMSSRYDSPATEKRAGSVTTSLDTWKAMDEGEDPTA